MHSTFDKLRRIDTRDYPEAAIRETLLNLLAHRDYSFSASTLIRVYTDRIEFVSIGGLLAGVSLEDVMLGLSICRNEKLANIFYRLELIESYGTGMRKIMGAYKDSGKTPQIETTENAFKIVLPNLNAVMEQDEDLIKPASHMSKEEQILLLAKENGFIARNDVEALLHMSQSTSNRLLKRMVKEGQLRQDGSGRMTKYILP